MRNALYIAILALIASPLVAYAQEQKGIDKHLENISGQYAECTAYYELVYHAMNSSNEKETANAYRKLEENAMFYSLLLADEGRSKDLAVEVTNSRIEMYMKKMKQETNNRNENISILIDKYHFRCQDLMENPPNQVLKNLKAKAEQINNQSADDLTYKCKVKNVYELNDHGSLRVSNWEKQFKGGEFSVSFTTGEIVGKVIPTLMANSTKVINKGNESYSFKSIAEFDAVNKPLSTGSEDAVSTKSFQLLEIQVFRQGTIKPFVAMSMGGAGIVTGTCKCKK